jgi:hypothetical protein
MPKKSLVLFLVVLVVGNLIHSLTNLNFELSLLITAIAAFLLNAIVSRSQTKKRSPEYCGYTQGGLKNDDYA